MSKGYSADELDAAQEQFGLRFPPDLIELLLEQRIPGGYDWVTDAEQIVGALGWPLRGLLFDVENAGLWWPEWGNRPADEADRAAILAEVVKNAPRLIPLRGHRYLPEHPHERGNPVFSVHQSDIIVYGADLADWMRVEFDPTHKSETRWPVREIEFWSETLERNFDDTYYPFRADE